MTDLLEAANAVLNRYDRDDGVIDSRSDFDVMNALRQAVQEAEAYKPMTDDELISLLGKSQIYNQYSGWALEREVERAVIKRLGLVWGEQ